MPRAKRPCSTVDCPNLVAVGTSRCDDCETAKQSEYRSRRDPVTNAHYKSKGHARFRRLVLDRDALCVLGLDGCTMIATDADHFPLSLKELLAQGLDPNNPANGRGLCHSCHSKETARLQPGGWRSMT